MLKQYSIFSFESFFMYEPSFVNQSAILQKYERLRKDEAEITWIWLDKICSKATYNISLQAHYLLFTVSVFELFSHILHISPVLIPWTWCQHCWPRHQAHHTCPEESHVGVQCWLCQWCPVDGKLGTLHSLVLVVW